MRCPCCEPSVELRKQALESALSVYLCERCGGTWVRAVDYWRWRAEHKGGESAGGGSGHIMPADSEGLKLCPEDGHILGRYRVAHGVEFALDHCAACEGVWLDRYEWYALRELGLHQHLPEIFSEEWQREVRSEERREVEQGQWVRQLGEEDFARIREVRQWIDTHPRRSELYAFLSPANDAD